MTSIHAFARTRRARPRTRRRGGDPRRDAVCHLTFVVALRRGEATTAYEQYRANLGRGILLGLEFLVGADIIVTVTAPLTWESVGLLGAIIVIRTLLSFSLETEIEGVAPWRRREADRNREEQR